MFRGSFVALITPFGESGRVDEDAFARLVDWQIGQGTNGIVPVGTTGESPTLSHDEHKRVIEIAVNVSHGRVPVIAGTGSNSTEEAIELTRHAQEAGADAALVVTPYYNKPTQEGLFLHYSAIANAVDIPIVIYNIPPRSVVDMSAETMGRLAKLRNVVGVKDSTANLARPLHTRASCGPDFCQLSGEDHTALSFLAAGGVGCISVTANIAPRQCAEMHAAWAAGDVAGAIRMQDRLVPLHDALFSEASPGPVKYGASLLGLARDTCRLPLAPIADATRVRVREAMAGAGLLN